MDQRPAWMDHDEAREHLIRYYHGQGGTEAYSGARFDSFGHNPPDRIVADDLVAVSLLNGRIRQHGPVRLLETDAERITELIAGICPDRDLHDVTDAADIGPGSAAWKLWELLRQGGESHGAGPVAASKLLARKRPRLLPIWDRRIGDSWGLGNPDTHWEVVRTFLYTRPEVVSFLRDVAVDAKLPHDVSVLRTLDVLLWMSSGITSPKTTSSRP